MEKERERIYDTREKWTIVSEDVTFCSKTNYTQPNAHTSVLWSVGI
jgi:hypothetical protein